MTRVALALALALAFALALVGGCSFDFARFVELEPGDIAGTLVREDGTPAAYAQVRVLGTSQLYTTGADGSFRVRGLPAGGYTLRFSEDENGDGLIERATYRSAALNVVSHPDGLFGAEAKLSFVHLGEVALAGVVKVEGAVEDNNGAPVAGADVFIVRDAELPEAFVDADGTARAATTVELTVETKTGSSADGSFRFHAVAAGDFKVIATQTQTDDTLFVSEPVEVSAAAGDDVDVTVTPLLLVPPPPTEREVQLELEPAPTDRVKLFLAEPKTEAAPSNAFASFDGDRVFQGARSISTTVPLGVHSVFVGTESGTVANLGVHLAARPGEPLVIWGTGVFVEDDGPCPMVLGGRDCDRDGVRELPPGSRATMAIVTRCSDQCADAFGSDAEDASCEVSGIRYDCDDDGDGQPDMTEPYSCRTLHAGGDWDHDGLCALEDLFDDCVSNNPADPTCGAGTDGQPRPPIAPEYDGEDFFEGGFDAGPTPTDAGPDDDAGANDAGPDDAGVGDAGAGDAGDAGAAADAGDTDAGPSTGARTSLPDNGFVDAFSGNIDVVDASRAGDGFVVLLETGSGELDLGAGCALASSGGTVVALFDGLGACQWARSFTLAATNTMGVNYLIPYSVAGLADGSVAFVGALTGTVDFGGTAAVSLSAEPENGFVVVYDFAGEPLVGRTLPSTTNGAAAFVGAHEGAPGELFVIGQFTGTLDLAGGLDPALMAAAASTDAYIARLSVDLSAQWLVPMGASFATAVGGAMSKSSSVDYPVIAGRFSGTLLPGDVDHVGQAGDVYIVTFYDDGVVEGWASARGFNAEPLVVSASRARRRMILGGTLPAATALTVTDGDGIESFSLPSGPSARGVVLNLNLGGFVQDAPTVTADTGFLELGDVTMDDRGTLYLTGRFAGDASISGTGGLNMGTPSISDPRAFFTSWRPSVQNAQLDGPTYSVVNGGSGAATAVVALADYRVFLLGDLFSLGEFEGVSVSTPSGQKMFNWRLSDSLLELPAIVAGDTWARELARQRFVEIKGATGTADGGFAIFGTYPVTSPSLTPPLALGGACGVLDLPEEFSFLAKFDGNAACEWVRTIETYREVDAGPSNTATVLGKAVVQLTGGHLVVAMEASSGELTFGDDDQGTEQRFDPRPYRSGVLAQYTAAGVLTRTTQILTNNATTDLTALTLAPSGGYAVTGSFTGFLRVDAAGSNLSILPDPSVSSDVFFSVFTDEGQPNYVTKGGSMDTGASADPIAMAFVGGELVVTGFGSGTVFGGANGVSQDNSSMWVAGVNPVSGVVDWSSRITGVYGDDVALAGTADGSRVVLATNFGYDDQTSVTVYDTSDGVAFTEPGTTEPSTGLFFYNPTTGAPIAERYIRGTSVNDSLAVKAIAPLSGGDLYIAGDSYNTITAPTQSGGNPTYPSPNTDMAFAFRFTDPGSDLWGSVWIARSFVGDARIDGATTLADDTLLTWGQAFDDVRYISFDYLLPGSGPLDVLWFVPTDGDE